MRPTGNGSGNVGSPLDALPLALATSALSAERKLFDAKSFAEAQSNGAPILVDISASWCPTCKAQKPIIDSLAEQPENKTLVIFAVDFDSQKPIVRELRAQSQSTLIAFQGRTEVARSVGDTDPGSIAALVKATLTR
jgi:thioredoxin 1